VERYWLAADRDQNKTVVAMLVIMATVFSLPGQQTTSDGIPQTISAKIRSPAGSAAVLPIGSISDILSLFDY
jgi:hypothetical protein